MSDAVYLMCALTSLLCAGLLLRGYRQGRHRLLFWSSLCFVGLAINNVVMVLDQLFILDSDLRPLRHATAHIALWTLLFGLVWTSRSEP